MKKIALAMTLGLVGFGLVGCAEIPETVDERFHAQAMEIFIEVDNDVMELDPEGIDSNDFANYQLVQASANTEREIHFVHALEAMMKLYPEIRDNRTGLAEYLKARDDAMNAMNLTDTGESGKFEVDSFRFIEEGDEVQ